MKFEYPELIWINHFLSLQLFSFLHVGEKVSDCSLLVVVQNFCSNKKHFAHRAADIGVIRNLGTG